MPSSLSPTPRSTPRRHADRALADRGPLYALLDEALICHLGVVLDGAPLVIPTSFGYDPDGPDLDGTLYLHGSVASRSLIDGAGTDVCVTVTLVDGLVVARSGFHHSMNYRSAVIRGRTRSVTDADERGRALDLIVDHAIPGRAATLRASTRKELAATTVMAVPLHEASMKMRTGGPVDDEADVAAGAWAGEIAIAQRLVHIRPDEYSVGREVPGDVTARVVRFL
jgi:nitroimidazol reductase NimA-like FMN-containing flavoprotein (pyridoxamine 5'-phosphate oxidase superfamily)